MKILGIESSCDETAAAVVEDGTRILSNVVHSQIDIHAEYGGVVPEIAARSHIEVINPVIKKALSDANLDWDDIDAIAVANAPGLIGSLLVGTLTARTLAELHNKPLYPVHHVEGHIYANFITEQASHETPARAARGGAAPTSTLGEVGADRASGPADSDLHVSAASTDNDGSGLKLQLPKNKPTFPTLALAVSGLHSQLILFKGHGDYELFGETLDDAVGEAFDKVARILGLPYPGGPAIAEAALLGNPHAYPLPKAKLKNPYSFSFSGLKTAVLRAVQREVGVDHTFASFRLAERLNDVQRANFAASFQYTAIKTLVDATEKAYREFSPASVVIAGGVAANQELRRQLSERLPLPIEYAPIQLCTDNAAMIATLGYYQARVVPPSDPLLVEVHPSVSMRDTAWAL